MHEMRFHRKALAVDQMLARMMEVKLQQLVLFVAKLDRAARGGIELDRVAVVHDGLRAANPVDLQRGQIGADRLFNVDRRLLRADRTDAIRGVGIAPMGGPFGALIAPVMAFRGKAFLGAERTKRKAGEDAECVTTIDGHEATPSERSFRIR